MKEEQKIQTKNIAGFMDSNVKHLYDAMISQGYTGLGDFSNFEGKMKDSGKRRMVYDYLIQDDYFSEIGDFSKFESALGYSPAERKDYVSQSGVNPAPIALRQEADVPMKDQSEYVNPWTNSPDYNFESLRKKGKIETSTPPPPTEYEKDSSFMNTWAGDAIQKLNAGGADLGAGIFGVLDKVSKGLESATGGLIPRGGAFKDISDRFKADAEFSRARSNRYNGKDFTDLWKEGNYMGAIGDIALQGVESLPMSIGAMAATMAGAPAAGLAGIGSIVASQKYDDLDQNNPNMGEFAKVSNAILTGTAESLSEMLGAGVSKAWMSTLFKTLGKEKAQEAIKRGIMGKMQEFYKKFGMFFEPVNEGIEEVSSTLAENITDKITGADPERDLTDGVLQSFVYGMGGGAYFTGAGALAKGAQYVADKTGGKQAQQPITDSNVTDQGVETPPLLTKSRFAEAEEQGRNMTDPGDIRTASKKMEETRLSLSEMVPGLVSTIESYVDDGASEAQVMSLLDGVNADARPLAEDFYADYLRISGLQDRIGEEIDNEVETYVANNITPYVTTNPDGQSIVTTATLSEGNVERPVYVRSIEGDKAVISDNGQDRMVSVKRLSDIVEQDAGHMRRTYEDQLLATRQSELDMTMNHNPKTQLPKPGLIVWNGDNAFILQGQDENGDWIAQPAAYDRETGQVTAKNGSSPAMPITENEILDLQDAIYDAQQVNVVSPEDDNVASADAEITSAPPVEDAINQPTSEIETEGAIDQIAQPSNVENPSMVMREDGTPDFVSSGTDMTLDFLHDKYGDKMPRKIEVTRKSFDESLKKASDALEKAQEAYDDTPIGKEDKAEAALIKARQEYEAIKVEADFWANLDDDIKEASKKPGDVIAKDISVMGDPMSGEELAAMMLANGAIKLTRDSYKKETGAGNNETARMFGLFASPEKGGVNIERAGEILELADKENGTNFFDENDTNAGRDAIIEVLSSAHTRGDLIDYVKRNREAIAERERQAEYNAYTEWCEENYHMSPEEYEAYEESMVRDFSEKQLTDEERGELDSQIVDEIQAIIDEQNEIDAILAQNKPIENENIEGNDESGGDGLREGGGEVLPREQLDQTGGTGEVEGKESAGPDIDRTDGVTQESASGEVASKNNATGNNWLDNVPNDGRNYFVYVRFPDENRYRAIDLGNGRTVDRLAFASMVKRERLQSLVGILPAKFIEGVSFQIRDAKGNVFYEYDPNKKDKPFVPPSQKKNENPLDYAERIVEAKRLHEEELKVDTNPTEAQKEAGNYKKGHIKINGFDVTIEQPSGSVRSGKDASGKEWSQVMNNTYGYIRGTESVDGDHIDVFLGPDMNSDMVYVVDQVNTDGSFDEHKVMMGFPSLEDARSAYFSNYEDGWQGLGNITGVALDEFKKWIDSSTRKTKPFYEYKGIKQEESDISKNNDSDNYSIVPSQYTTKKGKVLDMRLLKFGNELSKEQQRAAKELAKAEKGWYDREQRGFMMRSDESARRLADTILGDTDAVSDAQPISLEDTRRVVEPQKVNVENLIGDINDKGKAKLSDRTVTPSGNRLVTDERYAELRERMRRKLGGQMNMGVDPEILAIGTEMAVYHIEKGLRKFSDYSKAMIDDLGDAIRPYLKAFYNGARDLPEVGENGWDKDMTTYEDVRSFDVANFDKPVPDIMDAAETVVRETEIAGQAIAAKKKIKNSRKKQTDNKDKPLPLYGNDLFTPNNIKDNEQGNSRADQGVGRKAREEDRGSERGGDRGGVHGSDVLDTERGRGIPISDSDKRPVVRNQNNFSFPEKGIELPSGDISKLKANIEAIETLKDVEDGQGKPTPEQQAKMSRYVGWGGLAEALNEGKYNVRDNNWTKDRNWNDKYLRYYEKLKSLLSKEEFDSAVRSTTTSHYTPSEVVESLWGITEKLGFKGGNISEPAMGIGNIIGMMPRSISENSSISGFEIDSLSGRMAKALYPDAKIKAEENKIAGLEEAVKKPWGKEDELNAAQAEVNDLQRQLVEKAKAEDIQLESTLDVDGTLVKEEGETRFRFMGVDTTNNQDNVSSIESSINDWSNKLNTPVRVIHDVDDINDTDENMLARKRDSKGWYDTSTGEIVIVSPNSTSVGDAQRTFLHEVVGHHGLRELFRDDFDTFLDNVYRNANEDIRKNIIDRTKGNPLNLREATEEYIAELAERGFDNKAERSLWEKIKDSFLDMLRKAGISLDFKLSDNNLRYILWRSYKNLEQGNLMDVAEDIVIRNRLGLNNINLNENGSIERDIEPEKGKQPSETKGTGRELETIEGVDENGNESERDHIDKPRGVENSIDGTENATDRNGRETDGQVDNDGDQLDGGDTVDRNGSVRDGIDGERTVIGRAGSENKGRGVGESVREKTDDFTFAEKTIRFRENAWNESVLFADNDIQVVEKQVGSAKDQYERTLSTSSYQFQEAFQDSMLGLKTLQDAVAKATRSRILDYENAYMAENALSSVNEAEFNAYRKAAFEPILKAMSRLEKMGSTIDEIRDYLITKHGIERNREMAVKRALSQNSETYKSLLDEYIGRRNEIRENGRSWEEQQSEMDRLAEEYGANLSDDFSGFTSMYPNEDNTGYDPDSARRYVLDYESRYDTSELSASVKRATDAILAKQRDSGLMSQNTFDSISDMYQFYVPLRGWEETTADEVYAYLTSESQTFNAPIKTVVGRKSKADDPIATIANMAESGIMQGNRNLMKQKFLTMVQNHKTDLVSVSEMWVRLDEASGEWIAVFPDIPSNANPEQVESIVESFNKRMEELSNEKGSNVRRSRDAIGIPYKILPKDLKEHQVIVKRAGKEYLLTINGNPRAAQALNGLTNPDNTKGWFGTVERYAGWLNRNLAANFTTRNPNFMVSNFLRDALYSNTTVWVKESPVYAWKFNKNFAMVNPINMYRLVKGYENGTLDMSDPLNKAYHDFVMRGGETGYTNLRDVEAKKKAIQKELQYSKQKVSIGKTLKILGEWMDLFNKSVENCARFAAFLTSREMGRSMDKSIYDAKEISVNFNKKGAGSKFLNTEGQTKIGNASAFTSGLSRSMYVFWNAGVQGMYNFGRLAKDNPKKFLGLASSFYLLGTIMPMLAAAFWDDEDDDYYDLPEYVRRNNICFRNGGGNWITIPMPIELRAIYGLGEMSSGIVSGKEKYTDKKMAMKIAEQMSQVLPLDMMEGGGGFSAFVPSSVKPLIEAGDNKDWTGLPLYKDNDFNKGMPEWTKAFKSVDPAILAMTKYANELTGGDKYTTGTVNLNPAIIEHILDGYFGGIEATRSQMVKSAETAWGSRDFDWRNIPVGNRLIKSGDERTKKKAIDNAYYENLEEMDKIGQRLRGYRKELSNPQNDSFDIAEYQKKLNDLMMSDEYRGYVEFNNLNKLYQSMGEYLKKVDDERLEMELYDLKAMMNEIANGE